MNICIKTISRVNSNMSLVSMYAAMILAAFALPSIAMADSTDDGSTNVITGVQDLTGKTLAELKAGAVTAGTYPDTDMSKIFFLYNVKTGKFLNAGGYWGTHVSLQETPLSLWVNASTSSDVIDFSQSMGTGQGHLLRWTITSSTSSVDQGVYIDRGSGQGYYGWTLEAVSDDSQNTYKLYTYKTASPTSSSDKYYLCANGDETDQDKNCEAYTTSEISTNNLSGYDTWRIFSMQQIMDLQNENTDNMTSSLEMSFKLKCPGFARGNNDITSWTTSTWGTGTSSGLRFGLEKYYSTTPKANKDVSSIGSSNTYTFDGTTYSSVNTYQQQMGKYFCADAKNVRGVIYQDVKITNGGSYVVECKGYSNTTDAKLFAVLLDADKNVVKNTVHETVLNQISYMSETEQSNLHTSEQSMDYAGKNFYGSHKYKNTVLVHVPEITDNSYYYVRFGILIGEDNTDTTVDGDDEWTVFDDFRLLYASKTIDEDLILDEDRADMSYLSDCSNTYKNKVLHLNKTFTRNVWNSFVLPVSLTTDQLRQAFGANVRLAKLSALTSSEIQFTTVDLDNMNSTDTALIAYTPYIIYPTRYTASKESPAYKALLTETGNTEAKTTAVIVKANNVEIPNVSFATGAGNKNDLSNIDTDTWTTKNMYNVEGNGTMTACGTFVRTFGPDDTTQDTDDSSDTYGAYTFGDDKGTIISGRDDLKDCYFFWNGGLYSSSSRVRGLRGFSCWFKPTTTSTEETKMTMYLDGVAQDATADISDLVAFGKDETIGKALQGVYSISGQRISDGTDLTHLPAGLYIVNGKKCVVK